MNAMTGCMSTTTDSCSLYRKTTGRCSCVPKESGAGQYAVSCGLDVRWERRCCRAAQWRLMFLGYAADLYGVRVSLDLQATVVTGALALSGRKVRTTEKVVRWRRRRRNILRGTQANRLGAEMQL